MSAITELKELYLREHRGRYPNLPEYARKAPKYSDRTANGLTRAIIDYLRLQGCQAERIAVTGRYIAPQQVTDFLGNKRTVGRGKWIKGSMQTGSADISATVKGRSVKIEVKMKDKQSEAQKQYQKEIEQAGGVYIICRSFDDFLRWFHGIIG